LTLTAYADKNDKTIQANYSCRPNKPAMINRFTQRPTANLD